MFLFGSQRRDAGFSGSHMQHLGFKFKPHYCVHRAPPPSRFEVVKQLAADQKIGRREQSSNVSDAAVAY